MGNRPNYRDKELHLESKHPQLQQAKLVENKGQ